MNFSNRLLINLIITILKHISIALSTRKILNSLLIMMKLMLKVWITKAHKMLHFNKNYKILILLIYFLLFHLLTCLTCSKNNIIKQKKLVRHLFIMIKILKNLKINNKLLQTQLMNQINKTTLYILIKREKSDL